jgi:hypothetical protein
MSIDYDHRALAQAAMRWAAAATCERERLEWVRVALAWQDLASGREDATTSIGSIYWLSFAGNSGNQCCRCYRAQAWYMPVRSR